MYLKNSITPRYLKKVARHVYPDISDKEIKRFSAHMFRVTACVLLQHAGKPADYIQVRLRWESNAYKHYLRNTELLANQHVDAVAQDGASSCNAYTISGANNPVIPATEAALDESTGLIPTFE